MQMEEHRIPAGQFDFDCGTITGNAWLQGTPLPVDGCLIMFCEKGNAEISINSLNFMMGPGSMAFITFDMVAVSAVVSDDFEARFLSLGFETTQDLFFLVTSKRFWEFIYKSAIFILPHDLRDVARHWFSLLDWIKANCSGTTSGTALRNEAENFILIMAEKVENLLGQLDKNPAKNRAWLIVNDFVGLLNRHYATRHDVAYYAGKLNISPNYLNIITKRDTGITAKEHINIQIGLVIKMLLDTTDLTVKEIAERLNYDDPSYLCRIFRKQTGMSPIQYRNKLRSESD